MNLDQYLDSLTTLQPWQRELLDFIHRNEGKPLRIDAGFYRRRGKLPAALDPRTTRVLTYEDGPIVGKSAHVIVVDDIDENKP